MPTFQVVTMFLIIIALLCRSPEQSGGKAESTKKVVPALARAPTRTLDLTDWYQILNLHKSITKKIYYNHNSYIRTHLNNLAISI